jgi:hypothetical protein
MISGKKTFRDKCQFTSKHESNFEILIKINDFWWKQDQLIDSFVSQISR